MLNKDETINELINNAEDIIDNLGDIPSKLYGFAFDLVIAIIILIIGRYVIKLLVKLINKIFIRANIEVSVQKFLKSLINVVLYIILIIIVCAQVGIETTSFIAVLGSIGLAIGLALQGSLSNFAGGVLILMLKPFKVGDYIKNSSSGEEGTVNKIDLFYTNLITVDNLLIVVPNGTLANNIIVNSSAFDKRRMDIKFKVSYSSEIDKVKEIVLNMLRQNEKVLKDEEIIVFVKDFEDSQITMEFRAWFLSVDFWDVKFAILGELKKLLDDNNIDITFNQLEVHIKNS